MLKYQAYILKQMFQNEMISNGSGSPAKRNVAEEAFGFAEISVSDVGPNKVLQPLRDALILSHVKHHMTSQIEVITIGLQNNLILDFGLGQISDNANLETNETFEPGSGEVLGGIRLEIGGNIGGQRNEIHIMILQTRVE